MLIHNKFVGGNIVVERQDGNHIYLNNELRDTPTDWFYWAFCIEGAQGQELTFHFKPVRLGFWGPAVSHDLVNWHWNEQVSDDHLSFTYRFGADETKVYFAHHMLYHPQHFWAFANKKGLAVKEFCKGRKGNSVPCLQIGDGEISIVLTAHHHCCESCGGYILEGIVDTLVDAPIENTRILVVPFMDYEGVIDGDQGKDRFPHDHNRDYIDEPIYPEVRQLISYVEKYGCHYGFDFHSPFHWKREHDYVYIMRRYKKDRIDRFSDLLLDEYVSDGMKYSPEWNQPLSADKDPMTGKKEELPQKRPATFNAYMNYRPENIMAFTMECSYAGTKDNKISQERLRVFGAGFARALNRFIKEV